MCTGTAHTTGTAHLDCNQLGFVPLEVSWCFYWFCISTRTIYSTYPVHCVQVPVVVKRCFFPCGFHKPVSQGAYVHLAPLNRSKLCSAIVYTAPRVGCRHTSGLERHAVAAKGCGERHVSPMSTSSSTPRSPSSTPRPPPHARQAHPRKPQ
jgi:hypothetical protein